MPFRSLDVARFDKLHMEFGLIDHERKAVQPYVRRVPRRSIP